jgi:hypothetical protein
VPETISCYQAKLMPLGRWFRGAHVTDFERDRYLAVL